MNRFVVLAMLLILNVVTGCAKSELMLAVEKKDVCLLSELIQKRPDDFSGITLEDVSLDGLQLHDLKIEDVIFENVSLASSQFSNVTFEDCTFKAVKFEKSELRNVRFLNSTFEPGGSTEQDIVETSFNHSLMERVVFGNGCKLTDVTMHTLKKGSSLAIIDSTIEVIERDQVWLFEESYLDNFLLENTVVEDGVYLAVSILGNGNIVIRNSEIQESELYLEHAKKIVLEGNKDSILRIGGNVESVVVTKNERSSFGIDGVVKTVRATNNFGKTSGIGFGGKINKIEVTDCSDLAVVFSRGELHNATVKNCTAMRGIQWKLVEIGFMELQALDAKEINSAETVIKKFLLNNVELKSSSWIRDTVVHDVAVDGLSISPDAKLSTDEYYKQTEGFWNDLLAQQ